MSSTSSEPLPMERVPQPQHAFDGLTANYREHRPRYPTETLHWIADRLHLRPGDRIADVGAGTGIFTRHLLEAGFAVVAVEPSAQMCAHMRQVAPAATRGTAEALPLTSGCVRAVTAAQAFHWFDPELTLREWHRVIAPGGGIAVAWNNRDPERSAFVREFEALIVCHNPRHRLGHRDLPVGDLLQTGNLFDGVEAHSVSGMWHLDTERMVGFCRSVSYIAGALGPEGMVAFESDLGTLLTAHFPDGSVEVPFQTFAWTARRR